MCGDKETSHANDDGCVCEQGYYRDTTGNCVNETVCAYCEIDGQVRLGKKTPKHTHTFYQLTTMLAASKSVLFPGRNHLLTTNADDLTF